MVEGGWGLQAMSTFTSTNAVSVFSLSLSSSYCCTDPARWPVPCQGASGKKTGCPACARPQQGASKSARACHFLSLCIDSCCPALWGLSVLGEGSCLKTAPHPQPPTLETPMPTPPPPPDQHHHTALRIPEASAGPRRPGRLLSSCIKLSACPFLPLPPMFLLIFFPLSSLLFHFPSPPWFSTGKAVTLPPSPPHGSPAHVMFPSLFFVCVFI